MYYAGLILVDYYREYSDIIFKNIINSNINMNLSIFYEKADRFKTIRDLTYHISNVGVDLDKYNSSREDIDIAKFSYNDAKYIRREMQLKNEDLYYLYVYITAYSDNIKELEYLLNKLEGLLESSGIQTRRANFREEQVFLSCCPLYKNSFEIKDSSKKNILTSGIISTYPFISSSIFDESGIFFGTNMYNKSLIFIDRYDREKYKNGNMVVFGTSGAGKSFFIKLQILRYRLMGIEQYVIDPEREYEKICKNLNGVIFKIGPSSDTYINVLDIREESIEESKGYLSNKIQRLIGFFNLIFNNLNEEDRAILEESIIECYKRKNITFDDESLYKRKNKKRMFKESIDMPILEDLYNVLLEKEATKILALKLKPFISGSLKYFNNHTNIEINNKLIIADIYELRRRKY